MQQQLNAAGAAIEADGDFGARTRAAVVAFQQGAGLTPDGIVGPKTWHGLQRGGATVPTAPAAAPPAGGQPDPQQAILLAKLGQVRVAMQTVKAKSSSPAAAGGSQEQRGLKPSVGQPVPSCGIPLPDGTSHAHEAAHGTAGLVQRSFLDDAASWVGDAAESATEWVGERAEEVSAAADDAASWVGDKVDEAGTWAEEQVAAASEAVGGAAEWVGQEVNQAVGQVQEVVGAAKELVEGGIDVVVQTASELAKDVGEFGDDLKKRFANEIAIVQQVIQELGKPFGDLGGMIKQLDDILAGLVGGGKATNWFGWFEDEPEPTPSKVYAIFDVASTVTRGGVKVPGGTGYSEPTFTFKPVSWWRATDDAIMVQSTLNIDCRWEIASEGRGTSIASANDPAVTQISYLTIINDLEQMKESYLNAGPVVTTFWSEPLIERHELFHCRDYIGQATSFLPTAQTWLESRPVTHPPGNDAGVDAQVQDLVGQTHQKVEEDGMAHFKNGGEARAYGDGVASYNALITAIKARAKAEKWK